MYCSHCGKQIGENANFCPACGAGNQIEQKVSQPPKRKCPSCGSSNINVQMVSESQLKTKHRGCLWWTFVGWWWLPTKWIFLTIPALIVKIFAPKKQKLKTTHISMFVCQSCGHKWKA